MPVPTAPTLEIQGSEFPVARVYCISNAIPQTMKIEVGAVEPQRGCDGGGIAGVDVG